MRHTQSATSILYVYLCVLLFITSLHITHCTLHTYTLTHYTLTGKKKDAEHAAAARALDCLSFREGNGIKTMCFGLCKEDPYLLDDEESKFVIPSSTPAEFFDWLEKPIQMDTEMQQ